MSPCDKVFCSRALPPLLPFISCPHYGQALNENPRSKDTISWDDSVHQVDTQMFCYCAKAVTMSHCQLRVKCTALFDLKNTLN